MFPAMNMTIYEIITFFTCKHIWVKNNIYGELFNKKYIIKPIVLVYCFYKKMINKDKFNKILKEKKMYNNIKEMEELLS